MVSDHVMAELPRLGKADSADGTQRPNEDDILLDWKLIVLAEAARYGQNLLVFIIVVSHFQLWIELLKFSLKMVFSNVILEF